MHSSDSSDCIVNNKFDFCSDDKSFHCHVDKSFHYHADVYFYHYNFYHHDTVAETYNLLIKPSVYSKIFYRVYNELY